MGSPISNALQRAAKASTSLPPASKKRALPPVNKVGAEIAEQQGLVRGPNAWNQSDNNCLGIACDLAKKAGYDASPERITRQLELLQQMRASKSGVGYGITPTPESLASNKTIRHLWESPADPAAPGHIVIREGDELMRHASFENFGKEYNFGSAGPEWPIVLRVPLRPLEPPRGK
jgi:hypothetical protein